jgi:dihydrofolate reductase
MGQIIVTMFVSLDGVVEAPERWSLKYTNDDIAKLKLDELLGADALLLGRATYQVFADSWPKRSGEMAQRFNSLPKHVPTTTLKRLEWNNSHLLRSDLAEEVSKLKQTYARDILVYGGTTMVSTLADEDLVDEYRLLYYPVALGGGKRLFRDGTRTTLRLTETRNFPPNVVYLRYQPQRES